MVFDVRRISRLPLAVWCAIFFGLVAGILTVAAPVWQLERAVSLLGLDEIIPAAEPPLGHKARLLFGLLASVSVFMGILVPYVVFRLVRPRRVARPFHAKPVGATKRPKADAEVRPSAEAKARRPIFADQELGAPLMSEAALTRASVFEPAASEPIAVFPETEPAPSAVHPEAASPATTQPFVPDVPQEPAVLDDRIPTTLPLSEMIARLERGLNNRMVPPPPSPPAASSSPVNTRMASTPIAAPLSVVPRGQPLPDTGQGQSDETLSQAMRKLSGLVSNQR